MSRIKVPVVGTGMGPRHARVFAEQDQSELVAVADVVEERARRVADEHGVRAYSGLPSLLEQEEVDAVAVATPDHLHRGPVIEALQAGKHVFVEKPLATNIRDAREIGHRSSEGGPRVMINVSMPFGRNCEPSTRSLQVERSASPAWLSL